MKQSIHETTIRAQVADDRSVTNDQVIEYLLAHRDFFDGHPDLLEKLHIPHASGEAVSLVARQLELLREKNRMLQGQLESLVGIARDNDDLAGKMHRLVLGLFEAQTFQGALETLNQCLYDCFLAECVGVRIVDNQARYPVNLVFVAADDAHWQGFRKILQFGVPKCGHIDDGQAEFLFGEQAQPVRSCAIIPLPDFEVGGLLAIGSRDKTRFHPGMGHLFLQQMGEIVGCRLYKLLEQDS